MSTATDTETTACLAKLKRKRGTQRSNATRFVHQIDTFDNSTPKIEIEYVIRRLQETLDSLKILDDAIQDLLDDVEYEADVVACEDYTNSAKRAILKAKYSIEERLSDDTAGRMTSGVSIQSCSHSVRLPQIKLETFSGDIEQWSRFWEQFESSVDADPNLSTVNKHIFLRGYLDGEPKSLVQGIPVTAAAYEQTKEILRARYGDKNRIIQAHLDYLEGVTPVTSASPESLNFTFIECNKRIQALQALGENVEAYGRVLVPKILRAFPEDICRRWIIHTKRTKLSEGNILKLMEFLSEEVDGALTAEKIRGETCTLTNTVPSTAALNVRSKSGRTTRKTLPKAEAHCVFCEQRGHWAQDCEKVKDVQERLKILKSSNRCFLCLNQGHTAKNCRKKGKAFCLFCKKNHHKSICSNSEQRTSTATHTESSAVGNVNTGHLGFTHLQTARVYVTGPTGLNKLTRCILDGGSQSSFISRSLIDNLNLEVVTNQPLAVDAFESSCTTSHTRRRVRLTLKSAWNNGHVTITAFESFHSFSRHPSVTSDFKSKRISNLQLADPADGYDDLPIELLIGADHYWKIVKDTAPIRVSSSLALLPSKFGWILSGSRTRISANQVTVNLINLPSNETFDNAIRNFWDLETIGICDEQDRLMSAKDTEILREFHASYSTEDHRRVVRLPRKSVDVLPNNVCNAEKRFVTLERRMEKNEVLSAAYETQMTNYIRNDHVELAPSENSADTFYLPHQIVKKKRHGGTKWRIVFDASSHEKDCPSLNDILETGPNLLPEVTAVLMRFRMQRFAVVADIAQAFLQLVLHPDDRDLTRFFWYSDHNNGANGGNSLRMRTTYRFKRLPFGLKCSPFLLSATLRELATMYQSQFPTASALLDQNTYMDDFAAGATDENGAITLYYELTTLMNQIKLPMSKWATNSEQLVAIWKSEGREITKISYVLGVQWNTVDDTFCMDQHEAIENISQTVATKRSVLRATASFYDPLGLVTPVSIIGKILFQDTWILGLEWDELLPQHLATRWHTWMSALPSLSQIYVPRWIKTSVEGSTCTHVFCDASERAYGAVLYVRYTVNSKSHVQLMCSKSRLAPVKRVTLPRLELLAALIGTRLLRYYCKATNTDINRATLWTDSMVTLAWIKGNPSTWKTFVCNRVTEIQKYTAPSQWKHCPGKDNPADHLSRGTMPDSLHTKALWWHGPPWLSQELRLWPNEYLTPACLPETKNTRRDPQVLLTETPQPLIDIERFSSYWKLLRVTAHILRLKTKLIDKVILHGEFSAKEMAGARRFWIKAVQQECFFQEIKALKENMPLPNESKIKGLNPFLDEDLLRLGGRLHYAKLTKEERHPLIIDGNHRFTKLLILHTHIRLHHLGVRVVLSELRSSFWILHARSAIKKVIYRCLPCKIARGITGQVIEAPLPADRVTPHRPFEVIGVDFAGPLYAKTGSITTKCYIILFTCAVTRAIHLELAHNETTDRFLLALQRFIGRRGIPHTIYSDNAQTFHAANKEISELWTAISADKTHQYLAHQGITWKFIAPRAAWWGGFWERMIGMTKRCLRKVLGRSSMDEEGLQTVLVSIEAALNSRPISQTEDDVLTPAHFLVGEKLTSLPTGPEPPIVKNLTREFRLHQKTAEDFWKRWNKEYLMLLRNFHQVKRPNGGSVKIRVGDIVLLQEEVLPRHMWKKARVQELKEGRDGIPRTAILVTADGRLLTRPVQLVLPLEVDQGGEDVENR